MASSFLFWYKDKLIFSGVGGGGGRRSLFGKSSAKTFLENSFCGWLPLISVGAFTDWVLWVCCRCILPQGCQGPLALPALTKQLVYAKYSSRF